MAPIRLVLFLFFLCLLPASGRAAMPLLPRLYTPFQLAESLEEFRDREFFEHIHKFAVIDRMPPHLFTVGLLYEHGIGVEKDLAEALRWYRRAARAGYVFRPSLGREADAAVDRLTREGEPAGGPLAAMAAELDACVETAEEMRRLALRYYHGINAPIDHARSNEWERKAAAKEIQEDVSSLAQTLKQAMDGEEPGRPGERVAAQLEEVLRDLRDAVAALPPGLAGAGETVRPAADRFVPDRSRSQTLMEYAREIVEEGRRHYDGEGTPVDYFTAALRFSEAADFGVDEPLCYFLLAEIQDKGLLGMPNPYSAAKNYRLAADFGHAESMLRLAALHEKGRGGRQSADQARRWYLAAREKGKDVSGDLRRLDANPGRTGGDETGEDQTGEDGTFAMVERDAQFRAAFTHSPFRHREEMDRSRRWLVTAAANGQPYAAYHLGRMMLQGDAVWGVEKDPVQGRIWLEKAAAAGVDDAAAVRRGGEVTARKLSVRSP